MQPYKCIYLEVVSLKISLVSLKISFIFCTRRSQYTKNVSTVSVYERHWGGLDPPRLTRVVHSTCLVFHFLLWIRVLTVLEDPLKERCKGCPQATWKRPLKGPGLCLCAPITPLGAASVPFAGQASAPARASRTLVASISQVSNFTEKQLIQERHLWRNTKLQSGLSPLVIQ